MKISDDEGIIQIFFPASLKIFLIDGRDEDDDAAKHHIIKKGILLKITLLHQRQSHIHTYIPYEKCNSF